MALLLHRSFMLPVRGDQGHRQTYGCDEDWGSHALSKLLKDWQIEHWGGVIFYIFERLIILKYWTCSKYLNYYKYCAFSISEHYFWSASMFSNFVQYVRKVNSVWHFQKDWSDIETCPIFVVGPAILIRYRSITNTFNMFNNCETYRLLTLF